MSVNLDRIATVDIDIVNPVIEDMSFNKLLIVGPGPRNFSLAPVAGACEYGSIVEMEEEGWVTTGDAADPIGAAARIVFSQNPIPTKVYVAPTQPTAGAKRFQSVVDEVESVLADTMLKATPVGCTLSFDRQKRILFMEITGNAIAGISKTNLTAFLNALKAKEYIFGIDSKGFTDVNSFKSTPAFTTISALTEGQSSDFVVRFQKTVDGQPTKVEFGLQVYYPDNDPAKAVAAPAFSKELLSPNKECEPAVDTIVRAMEQEGWYAVCPAGVPSSEYQAIAELIETQEKIFVYTELDYFRNGEKPTVDPTFMRTAGVVALEYAEQDPAAVPVINRYANVAFTAAWFNYEPGSETAAFKAPRGGLVAGKYSKKQMDHMERDNLNYLLSVRNKVITMNGKMIGDEWADMIRFRDYLKVDMQNRIVDVFLKNPKIPYTDAGISLIHNAMEAALKNGQAVGGICYDEYDEDGDTVPGYVTKVPTAASISAVVRRSRKLSGCTFSARPTGAIHFAEITGSITYEISYTEGV